MVKTAKKKTVRKTPAKRKAKSRGSCTTVYPSETAKVRPLIMKYLKGKKRVIDFGCGTDKIVPHAVGVDMRQVPGVDVPIFNIEDVYTLEVTTFRTPTERFDVVYSSHFLEHLKRDVDMVKSWTSLLFPGGHLILYLPDDDYYDNASNPEHFQRYKYKDFVEKLGTFPSLKVVDHGPHYGPDCYSFWVVAEKESLG